MRSPLSRLLLDSLGSASLMQGLAWHLSASTTSLILKFVPHRRSSVEASPLIATTILSRTDGNITRYQTSWPTAASPSLQSRSGT
ncbi:hypothetical protein COCNU_07G013650 [Cocos nucifera]|uniref:Uncharacterized protein n=1 Tax=Cocos nucifera TaxID=13894 RepID=A0A8K0IGB4_COCNU|nr:hypothetical protein COCNU_07G013650 [Cocos nucifera]